MNRSKQELPIIIVKKKARRHGGHHGGAWKVAYADFVTAMMALFIVLWIVGQSKQVKQYVANYFRDPGAFFENTRNTQAAISADGIASGMSLNEEFLKRQEEKLSAAGEAIMDTLKKNSVATSLLQQIKFQSDKEGMRIELVETSQSFFFDIGTAKIKPEAIAILAAIGNEVGRLPNRVIIEGHTDSRPYSKIDGYTNFELSADRANTARRILVTNGIRENQIVEVRGYADNKLRNADNPFDETNRRISILIRFEDPPSEEHPSEDSAG